MCGRGEINVAVGCVRITCPWFDSIVIPALVINVVVVVIIIIVTIFAVVVVIFVVGLIIIIILFT